MVVSSRVGYKHSEETKEKIRQALKGERNGQWKGYDGEIRMTSTLHQWIRRNHPPPLTCRCCSQMTKLDLANITGVYNRNFVNWIYLCRTCHLKLDGKWNIRDKNGRFIR